MHSREERENLSRKLKEYFKHNKHPMLDKKHTIEARKKISQALKEHYKFNKNPSLGKHFLDEVKRKMSLAHRGKVLSKEHKRKIGEASKSWHREFGFTDEIKKKIGQSQKGKIISEETRRKISEMNKGHTGGWNKGLTKTDPRVKLNIENRTATVKRLYKEGKLKPWNLGKPWSEEVKNKISQKRKGKTYKEIMGKEKAIQFKKRLSELGKRFIGKNNPMYERRGNKNPHFGKPAVHGKHSFRLDLGHHCRSRWEANYTRYLLWIGKTYQYEPKTFEITMPNGEKGTYTPDFLVDGKEWQELKGWEDRSKDKKWKLFQQQYPQEILIFIGRNNYKEIEKKYRYFIPNWEF